MYRNICSFKIGGFKMFKFDDNKTTCSVTIKNKYKLNIKHKSVVQKGNVGSAYIYALQLRGSDKNIYILRGPKPKKDNAKTTIPVLINNASPLLLLKGKAGGHSETWEFSGIKDKWFVGTKKSNSKSKWDTQIARIDIKNSKPAYSSNLQLTRIGYLNNAGKSKDRFSGKNLHRVEIALSPDYTKFLVASVENNGTGHFSIYPAHCINEALDKAESTHDLVNLGQLTDKLADPDKSEIESFTVKPFLTMYKSTYKYIKGKGKGKKKRVKRVREEVEHFHGNINSVQGYDIDNDGNIYITSQRSPYYDAKKGFKPHHKQIIIIPSRGNDGQKLSENERSNMHNWFSVDLSAWKGIDISGKHTEVEGIQVIDKDHAYVTVAYHALVNGINKTVLNMIYELSWDRTKKDCPKK